MTSSRPGRLEGRIVNESMMVFDRGVFMASVVYDSVTPRNAFSLFHVTGMA